MMSMQWWRREAIKLRKDLDKLVNCVYHDAGVEPPQDINIKEL
jgi:hypothetical protein